MRGNSFPRKEAIGFDIQFQLDHVYQFVIWPNQESSKYHGWLPGAPGVICRFHIPIMREDTMRKLFVFCALLLLLSVQTAFAQAPATVGYQGVLTDASGKLAPDGAHSLTFKLYDVATGGVAVWTETQSVTTADGVFGVVLGSVTSLTVAFDRQYWLGITVGGGQEISPRVQLTASPYALMAVTVADGAVTSAKIADNAVTSAKIVDGAVSSGDLADGAVTTAKMADGAVTSDKIADGTIAAGDVGSGQVVKSLNTLMDDVTLSAGANVTITSSENTLTISASPGTITGSDLTDGAVTTAKLIDGAITSAKIADGTIADADISGSAAISPSKIGTGALDLGANGLTASGVTYGNALAITTTANNGDISLRGCIKSAIEVSRSCILGYHE